MRKTSRRSFTKSVAGALAVIPFAPSLASGQEELALTTKDAGDLDRENLSPAPQNQVQIFSEHNTPPPALLMEGSLIIEVSNDKKPNWPNPQPMGTNRRKWLVKPNPYQGGPPVPSNIYIAHIKVLDGSGDLLYPFDNTIQPDKQTPVEVTAGLTRNGSLFTCRLTVEGNSFAMDAPNGKKIYKKHNDQEMNKARHRVRFMEDSGGELDDFEFTTLRIDKGTTKLYSQDLTALPSKGKELRVMLWWEELK